ncbi:tetratricopeptide repeat protein 14 homolog isoform X6 [Nasonia vitripennis]|uniref:Tetratricopeptide repeat protein 14 homolog n=1 Tax=Nasonia vitripennis TaxID=7425 RepID=A0A7M7QW82_NASVI|nr:tetratricopeptide repeat protein 14 homolog isoform X6 [Nasonia vitripennis]
MDGMDSHLIAQALNYHGQQLQKVWESERNESELLMLNLKEPSFEIYQQRQKTLSFSDRGKRLKLQQFIAKKADTLYDKSNLIRTADPIKQELGDEEFYATMPGLDSFVAMEKSQRIRNFLESLLVGDVIFAQVMGKSAAGLLLKVLCNCSDFPRVVSDLGVKALILNTATVPAVDKKGVTRGYMANDLVCVVVGEVNVEAERVVAVMNVPAREGQAPHPPMGLVHAEDLPDAYKKAMDNKGQSYETIMENSSGFNNPNNIKYLSDLLGLGQLNYSNMVGLRERFPPNEYASELRQAQASKWAFRSVAEGIDHFKAGRHSEAFQCLNKALTVDPRNVEGLVARGALYANSGSFKKAIDDFETALKLNPSHANARKYMAETLVALGRSYEDEKKYEEALKAYENCLSIAPYHEEAKNSIEYIKGKTNLSSNLPTVTNSSTVAVAAAAAVALEPFKAFENEAAEAEAKREKKKRKKERKARSKKRQRWSSSSSSSSGGSSTSTSSSDSSGSSGSSSGGSSRSNSRSPGRKRKHKKDHHGSSLSPLSKRMAQYNNPPATATAAAATGGHLSVSSHDMLAPSLYSSNSREKEDYELKVRKFLEQTKDDSDYEDKVRKFLEETARWKREKEKEKKHVEVEKKVKKKKKEKKIKDKDKEEKKLRKKKKKEERKKRKNKDKLERDLQESLPDLDQLQSKLSAYYAKVEKETAVIKSNAEKLSESNRREDDMRREKDRDDVFKTYHDRDPRLALPPQRKEVQRKPFSDIFEQDSQLIHPEPKPPALDTVALNAKWKAVQASRQREPLQQKWQELPAEKKLKNALESEDEELEIQRPLDKSLNIRKHMQREIAEKRAMQQMAAPAPPPVHKDSPHKIQQQQSQMPIKYPTPQPQNKFQSYKDSSMMQQPQQSPQQTTKYSTLGHKFQPIGQASDSKSKGASRSDSESDRERGRRVIAGPQGSHKQPPPPHHDQRHSRSRSRSGSSSGSSRSRHSVRRSRSRSYSNRRSGSYERKYSRSPSGTYSGRSRSRSGGRSRSRSYSRSRSRSPDRGYYRKRFNNRPFNNRGTYYKPRFQPFNNQNRGRGDFRNHNNQNRFNNQNNYNNRYNNRRGFHHNQRGGHMMNHGRGGRMNNRGGRFFHNNRQHNFRDNFRDRRDFRDRRPGSRDRYSDRSYSPDPMRKVDEAKEKINKMIEEGGERPRSRDRSSRSRSRSRSHSRSHSRGRGRSRSRDRARDRSRSRSRDRGDRDRGRDRSSGDRERSEPPVPPMSPAGKRRGESRGRSEEEDDYERWGEGEEVDGKQRRGHS